MMTSFISGPHPFMVTLTYLYHRKCIGLSYRSLYFLFQRAHSLQQSYQIMEMVDYEISNTLIPISWPVPDYVVEIWEAKFAC